MNAFEFDNNSKLFHGDCIGYEIDEEYYNQAVNMIEEYLKTNQKRLFT